jgi:hypothetical protein
VKTRRTCHGLKRVSHPAGLTAIETVIMLVLFGAVMAAIYTAVVTGLRSMTINRSWLHADYSARRGIDRVVEETRWGAEVRGLDPQRVQVHVPAGMPRLPDRDYVVEFFRQRDVLVRRVDDEEEVLASGVVDFRARYFDQCGLEIRDPQEAAAEVRRVQVEVVTRHENYEGRVVLRRLRADAALRNYPWGHPLPADPPSPAPTPCF